MLLLKIDGESGEYSHFCEGLMSFLLEQRTHANFAHKEVTHDLGVEMFDKKFLRMAQQVGIWQHLCTSKFSLTWALFCLNCFNRFVTASFMASVGVLDWPDAGGLSS